MKKIYAFLIVMAFLSGGGVVAIAQDAAVPEVDSASPEVSSKELPPQLPPPTAEEILGLPEPKFELPVDMVPAPLVEESDDENQKVKVRKIKTLNLSNIHSSSRFRDPIEVPNVQVIPEIEYYDIPNAMLLPEEIDSLLFGIVTDLAPKHDVYGYEVRRYMAQVYSENIYTDQEELDKQLANVKRAKIILTYWENATINKAENIAVRIEKENFQGQSVINLNYNNEVAIAFFVDAHEWVDKSQVLLEFMKGHSKEISLTYPWVGFLYHTHAKHFKVLLNAREDAIAKMGKHLLFRAMVF